MVANILPADPPTQPLGSIGQNSTCSEHGPVAYQIKEESQMQQHGRKFCQQTPPCQHWGLNVKIYVKRYNIIYYNIII